MNKKDYKVLLINNSYDGHLIRLIKNLKEYNPQATIDVFTAEYDQNKPDELLDLVRNTYGMPTHNSIIQRIPVFRNLKRIIDLKKTIKDAIANNYDVINIHYPSFYYAYILNQLKSTGTKLLVTPWGSDVYRTSGKQRDILKKVFSAADNVCGAWNRFCYDVMEIMSVPKEKIVTLDIGSDSIDYISSKKQNATTEKSKQAWGLQENYVITCGYNGSPAQNHKQMIEAVDAIKDKLPSNLLLLFPMTYAGNKEYFKELQDLLTVKGIAYKFVTDFMSLDELFDLRMATDIFVHVQKSDANASSVQEYLLCEKKVVNGEWLRYKELEKNGKAPYYIAESLSTLNDAILRAYQSDESIISAEVIDYIESYGWKKWIVKWDAYYQSCKK